MSLGWIISLAACFAVACMLVAGLCGAGRTSNRSGHHLRKPRRKLSRNRSPMSEMPGGRESLENAGGPLDGMAAYDVNHRFWPIAVDDD